MPGPGLDESDSFLPPGEPGTWGAGDEAETQQEAAVPSPCRAGKVEAASQPGLKGWGRFGN